MPSAAVAAAIEVVLFTGEAILLARELIIPFPITYHVPRVARVGTQTEHPEGLSDPPADRTLSLSFRPLLSSFGTFGVPPRDDCTATATVSTG